MKKRITTIAVLAASAVLATTGVASAASDAPQTRQDKNIVQVASGAPQFSTLVSLIKKAGLVKTLSGKGPFTILAPTDEAFAKLPAGTLEMLLKPENKKQLVEILSYHVVPNVAAYSDAVVKMKEVPTLLGKPIGVKVVGDKVMLGDPSVVAVDVEASNGVIHVLDTVLLPLPPAAAGGQSKATNGSKY